MSFGGDGSSNISSSSVSSESYNATVPPMPTTIVSTGINLANLNVNTAQQSISSMITQIGLNDKRFFDDSTNCAAKLAEIRKCLDSASDKDKMQGMKLTMGMHSKGKDVSPAFPDVVKNVITPNRELRNLVYMYLVHYAEMEPQKALLAINSMQKAQLDPNQLLRASSLRSMSSIKVRDITQLIILAVGKGVKDTSAYVRKTAAHAISKILRLDPREIDQCVEMVAQLLRDSSTIVLGSAVQAFLEVCPTRYDLIHQNFRHICHVLPDIDEWGQVAVLQLLRQYGRTQFVNPDPEKHRKTKVPEVDNPDSATTETEEFEDWEMDPDHRLMLTCAQPLFLSHNSAVVLETSLLYFYLAPPNEHFRIGRALIRLLHSHKEGVYIVLLNIASMASKNPTIFTDHLSDFFINTGEPLMIRNLKLEILTHLANETNIGRILSEFKAYVTDENKVFVANTIQAIGRCATTIPQVSERCQQHLMQLIASTSEEVVAESVVVLKKLLQVNASQPSTEEDSARDCRVVLRLARLLKTVTAPHARASIVWVIGEYHKMIIQYAADIFRELAKSFSDESVLVKLQVLTLGTKLFLAIPEKVDQIFRYILQLAKYDQNYDIRDRARVMRQILLAPTATPTQIHAACNRLLFTRKPVPSVESITEVRNHFTLGTLSHVVNDHVNGYEPLPDFPEVPPDPSVRNVASTEVVSEEQGPFAHPVASASADADDGWIEHVDTGDDDGWIDVEKLEPDEDEEGEDEEDQDEDEEEEEEEDEWGNIVPKTKATKNKSVTTTTTAESPATPKVRKDSVEDLFGGDAGGDTAAAEQPRQSHSYSGPRISESIHLITSEATSGLAVDYCCLRSCTQPTPPDCCIFQLSFKNEKAEPITKIKFEAGPNDEGIQIVPFSDIGELAPGGSANVILSVKYSDLKPAKFNIGSSLGIIPISIDPPIGDLVRPKEITETEFLTLQNTLSESEDGQIDVPVRLDPESASELPEGVQQFVHIAHIVGSSAGTVEMFYGEFLLDSAPVLISVQVDPSSGLGILSAYSKNAAAATLLAQQLAAFLCK
ncbi:beta adaptin [Pelomyxa schiedti]|nr:beta adaptin [Pelomyxa schiedti]